MAIEFGCTQCGRQLQAGDATPGTRVLCPACGAFSTVPVPQAGPVPQPGPPIEFRCTECNKLLRTPADTAGRQAKCPECGGIVPVPGPGAGVPDETLPYPPSPAPAREEKGSPFAPGGEPAPAGDPENPYLAPTQYGQPSPQPFAGADPTAASRVSGPAVALIVTGALGIAGQVLVLISNLFQMWAGMPGGGPPGIPVFLGPGIGIAMGLVNLVLGVVVIVGAVKMKSLQSHSFAMAAGRIHGGAGRVVDEKPAEPLLRHGSSHHRHGTLHFTVLPAGAAVRDLGPGGPQRRGGEGRLSRLIGSHTSESTDS